METVAKEGGLWSRGYRGGCALYEYPVDNGTDTYSSCESFVILNCTSRSTTVLCVSFSLSFYHHSLPPPQHPFMHLSRFELRIEITRFILPEHSSKQAKVDAHILDGVHSRERGDTGAGRARRSMTDPHGGGPSLLCAILDLVSGECGEARVGVLGGGG